MIFVLLVFYIFARVAINVLYKVNKQPTAKTMFVSDFWCMLFCIILFGLSFAFWDNPLAYLTWEAFGWITLRSVLGVFSFFAFLQAIKRLPVSIFSPVATVRIAPLVIVGQFVFGDAVTIAAIVLASVIFVSSTLLSIVLSNNKSQDGDDKTNYGVGFAWLFVFIVGLVSILILIRHIGDMGVNVFVFAAIAMTMMFIIDFIVLQIARQKPIKAFRESWNDKILLPLSVLETIIIVLYVPLVLAMNIGILDAIMVSATALTVLAGVVILKERIRWHGYILIAIILGCAVALSLV